MNPESQRELPRNIRNFLTVTKQEKPKTSKPEPSPLLSRVAAFLPELEAANKALTANEKSTVSVSREDALAKQGDVQMDIYVDNTLGELVPTEKPKQLIEELPERTKPTQ